MLDNYILDGHTPVPARSLWEWAIWFEKADRRVAFDVIAGVEVSTVFLGIDHNFRPSGPPILFETMVFGDDRGELETHRYSTWKEAEEGHARAVASLRAITDAHTFTVQ